MNKLTNRWKNRLPFLGWAAVITGAGLALAVGQKVDPVAAEPSTGATLAAASSVGERTSRLPASFAPVVKEVAPSVVQVFTSRTIAPAGFPDRPGTGDPFFRWFFGPQFEERGLRRGQPMPRQQGIGSGVVVTPDGYILTNNHVVEGADEVKVKLQDGREFTAAVVGRDPKTDVAVLKANGEELPHIAMADSDAIEVGDFVLAIGNPFGIGQTVTMGMVSAKGRGNMGLDYEDFIQTDAAINPGNSGGALVDTAGHLIGINTAILSRSGGNQGIGFAIPTNLARFVMDSLVRDGRISRGYLGVLIQDVTPTLAKEFGLTEPRGALVGDVNPGGPAGRAGVENGDVIVEFDGKEVRDSRQLKLTVAQTRPGAEVPVKVLRDGKAKTLEVKLAELPGDPQVARADAPNAKDQGTLNGVVVSDLDSRARRQLDAPANLSGALVTDVAPDSAALEAGLRPGDVILEINRRPVRTADDAIRLTEKAKDRTTLVRVWRDGHSRYVVVDETRAS
ncbi:MAG: DegQ family serine endoprotease [Verrucomicrobia bacterium]|nr:DegQ family serine endoprotease [Verrucomicrobiota bacterium]